MRIFFIVNTASRHCAIFQIFNPFQAYCSHFIPPDNIRKSLFFRGNVKGKLIWKDPLYLLLVYLVLNLNVGMIPSTARGGFPLIWLDFSVFLISTFSVNNSFISYSRFSWNSHCKSMIHVLKSSIWILF